MHPTPHVICETLGAGQLKLGCITLNRPSALNALSLDMVRAIAAALLAWEHDPAVLAVVMRGSGKDATAPHFGHFCAGGDIRFFHAAALAGDPALEDFFTEEYALNHRISQFPKPMLWLLDGVVMGGGMGLCAHDPQTSMRGKPVAGGMRYRVGTERTQAAMPETLIGLFPDVGGGWFLARSPGALGEYLALTGVTLKGAQACAAGWLDGMVQAAALLAMWAELAATDWQTPEQLGQWVVSKCVATNPVNTETTIEFEQKKGLIDRVFALPSLAEIIRALEAQTADDFAQTTAKALRARSPLMQAVTLSQVRRARHMTLAQALRMERDMVRHCFHAKHLGRSGADTDTAEGIRALAVDKDHAPKWSPQRIEDVTDAMVAPFFDSPWPANAHPLRHLG